MLREKPQDAKRAVKGFRLPTLEYEEDSLDLYERLIIDKDNTYYMKMDTNDMSNYRIYSGSLLVIDRSLTPVSGSVIVFFRNGDFYTREYVKHGRKVLLKGNNEAANMELEPGESLDVFGVVMVAINNVLHPLHRKGRYLNVCSC